MADKKQPKQMILDAGQIRRTLASEQARSFDRLTALITLHHQTASGQPHTSEAKWSQLQQSEEQPYRRRVKLSGEPKPLALDWFEERENVGLIVLVNVSNNKPDQRIPSEEELSERQRAVVEYGIGKGFGWIILPGEAAVVRCSYPNLIRLKAPDVEAICEVNIFPN